MITQFAFHDRVANTPPECRMKELYDTLSKSPEQSSGRINAITPDEEHEIFDKCRQYNGIYKLAGWQFDFRSFMKRYVMKQYGNWSEIYAFNKSNIRNNVYTKDGIVEIHEIPKR
jgi:hypothetical protein